MAFLRGLWLIFTQTTKELFFSGKTLLFLAGCGIYAAAVALVLSQVGDQEDNNDLFAFLTLGIYWQGMLPLTAMFFSISAIRDEIADRTIVFLFDSPIPRSSIWLGKMFAASVVTILILLIGYAGAVFLATRVGDDGHYRLAQSTLEAPWLPIVCGAPAYAAVGTLLAVFFKRSMLAGAIYVIGWEQFIGATPGQAGARQLTVIDSVRTMFYHRVEEAGQFRRAMRDWATGGEDGPARDAAAAFESLLWLTGICVALALILGARKDYDSAPKE